MGTVVVINPLQSQFADLEMQADPQRVLLEEIVNKANHSVIFVESFSEAVQLNWSSLAVTVAAVILGNCHTRGSCAMPAAGVVSCPYLRQLTTALDQVGIPYGWFRHHLVGEPAMQAYPGSFQIESCGERAAEMLKKRLKEISARRFAVLA